MFFFLIRGGSYFGGDLSPNLYWGIVLCIIQQCDLLFVLILLVFTLVSGLLSGCRSGFYACWEPGGREANRSGDRQRAGRGGGSGPHSKGNTSLTCINIQHNVKRECSNTLWQKIFLY